MPPPRLVDVSPAVPAPSRGRRPGSGSSVGDRSRRWALARAGAVLGGGLGVAGSADLLAAAPASADTRASTARRFTVEATGMGVVSGLPPAGAGHRPGDRWLVTGSGQLAGGSATFVAEVTTVEATTPDAGLRATVEHHVFTFPAGTLIGSGTSGHHGRDGVFAVLGGTGEYAGARGSYTATQRLPHHGGDGTAVFHFTLSTASEETR